MKVALYLIILVSGFLTTNSKANSEYPQTKSFIEGTSISLMPFVRPLRPYSPNDTASTKAWKSLESGIYTLIEALPSWIIIALLYIGVNKANHCIEGA